MSSHVTQDLKRRLFQQLCIDGKEQLNDYELEIRELLSDDPDIKRYLDSIAHKILAISRTT